MYFIIFILYILNLLQLRMNEISNSGIHSFISDRSTYSTVRNGHYWINKNVIAMLYLNGVWCGLCEEVKVELSEDVRCGGVLTAVLVPVLLLVDLCHWQSWAPFLSSWIQHGFHRYALYSNLYEILTLYTSPESSLCNRQQRQNMQETRSGIHLDQRMWFQQHYQKHLIMVLQNRPKS